MACPPTTVLLSLTNSVLAIAKAPTTVFTLPVVTAVSVLEPKAEFPWPVVRLYNTANPKAVFPPKSPSQISSHPAAVGGETAREARPSASGMRRRPRRQGERLSDFRIGRIGFGS